MFRVCVYNPINAVAVAEKDISNLMLLLLLMLSAAAAARIIQSSVSVFGARASRLDLALIWSPQLLFLLLFFFFCDLYSRSRHTTIIHRRRRSMRTRMCIYYVHVCVCMLCIHACVCVLIYSR